MDDHYLTASETLLLLAIFVLPFMIAGAIAQFLFLKRTNLCRWRVSAILSVSALATLPLTLGLMYIVPHVPSLGYSGAIVLPALTAAIVVTGCVWIISRWMRGAA